MIIEILGTPAELAAARDEWSTLFTATPEVSGFQSHAWVSACWSHESSGHQLHVGVARSDGRAVAVFPMQRTARGRLTFIGRDVSNYSGPVYDPAHLEDTTRAWAEHLRDDEQVKAIDLAGLRERSPFFQLVRDSGLPGWGDAVMVATHTCTEVDLEPGWKALYERHKSKQRSTWRRKATRLGKLGELEFVETSDAAIISEAMPRMVELFAKRWEGQRVDGFASQAEFQRQAAQQIARDELALLSTLRLDGEIVAFAYGIRGAQATSSYVLAHDDRFHRFSPGLLLLLRVLEAASERGDVLYDFSVGEAPYKSLWMTGQQDVYRALWGAGRRPRAAWSAARARARSVDSFRALKLGGLRSVLPGRAHATEIPDAPGLPAGPVTTTIVYELTAGAGGAASLRRCSYGEMCGLLSPRLLSLAVERSFRGDELLVVEGGMGGAGLVWRASAERRSTLLGETIDAAGREVYYHPVPMTGEGIEGVVASLQEAASGLVVVPRGLSVAAADAVGETAPDPGTWAAQSPEQ